jgi:hypothetical protein
LGKPLANAAVVKEIAKGQRVTLTGETSKDDSMLEAVYNGDKGWLAKESVFAPLGEKTKHGFTPISYSKLDIIVLTAIILVMYAVVLIRMLRDEIEATKASRSKFKFFDNYIKVNGDTTVFSVIMGVTFELVKILAISAVITFGFNLLFNILVSLILLEVYATAKTVNVVLLIGTYIGALGAVIVAYKIWSDADINIDGAYDRRCPRYGCPVAYAMMNTQNTVTGERKETKTVKSTGYRHSANDLGDAMTGGGTKVKVTTYTDVTTTYYTGKTDSDYKCFNCGQKKHESGKSEWINIRPDEVFHEYDQSGLEKIRLMTYGDKGENK